MVGRKEKPKGQVNIKDAEIVVSAGRGFKKKEDLSILDDLAKVINAVVGASRPLDIRPRVGTGRFVRSAFPALP